MSATRLLPAFSTAFAVLYGLAVACELPSFLYYPAIGELTWTPRSDIAAGPPMAWYGWIACAAAGALLFALAAVALPRTWDRRVWPLLSAAAPWAMTPLLVYVLRGWFQ